MPRISQTLEERTDAIEGGLKRAEERAGRGEAGARAVPEQLADARQEAARLREQAREQGAADHRAELREQGAGRAPAPGRGRRTRRSTPTASRPQGAAGRGRRARGGSGQPGGRASRWRTRPGSAASSSASSPSSEERCRPDRPGPGPSHEGREPGIAGGGRRGAAGCPGRRGPTPSRRLGDELFAVTDLLDREAGLRRALTDPSRRGEARAGLASRLLSAGRSARPPSSLVATLAEGRWSAVGDLADAAEQLRPRRPRWPARRAAARWTTSRTSCSGSAGSSARSPSCGSALADPLIAAERKRQLLDSAARRQGDRRFPGA